MKTKKINKKQTIYDLKTDNEIKKKYDKIYAYLLLSKMNFITENLNKKK